MWTQLTRSDSAHVLTTRVAVTRRPQPLSCGSHDATIKLRLSLNGLGRLNSSLAPAPRNDDTVRVRNDRVEHLDLHAHDGVQARLVGSAGESDGAIQALVICQRQARQPQLECALH